MSHGTSFLSIHYAFQHFSRTATRTFAPLLVHLHYYRHKTGYARETPPLRFMNITGATVVFWWALLVGTVPTIF